MMREVVLGFLGLDDIINTHHLHQMINHNCWVIKNTPMGALSMGGAMGRILAQFVPREGLVPNDEGGCLGVSGT